jgi:serine/threonine protein phosphatase 1
MTLASYVLHDRQPIGSLLRAGTRVYAIGDIHGRVDCLEALLKQIDDDRERFPAENVIEIFLGDYVDRGPNSREVLDVLIARQKSHSAICLLGNHDISFMGAITGSLTNDPFALIGGAETCTSYGVDAGHPDYLRHLQDTVPQSHREFLHSLKEYHILDGLLFVHAGVDPSLSIDKQTKESLCYIRTPFLNSDKSHGFLVIHGHTMGPTPVVKSNRVGIDTAAFMTGVLTAIVLESEGYRFLATNEKPDMRYGKLKTRTVS